MNEAAAVKKQQPVILEPIFDIERLIRRFHLETDILETGISKLQRDGDKVKEDATKEFEIDPDASIIYNLKRCQDELSNIFNRQEALIKVLRGLVG